MHLAWSPLSWLTSDKSLTSLCLQFSIPTLKPIPVTQDCREKAWNSQGPRNTLGMSKYGASLTPQGCRVLLWVV